MHFASKHGEWELLRSREWDHLEMARRKMKSFLRNPKIYFIDRMNSIYTTWQTDCIPKNNWDIQSLVMVRIWFVGNVIPTTLSQACSFFFFSRCSLVKDMLTSPGNLVGYYWQTVQFPWNMGTTTTFKRFPERETRPIIAGQESQFYGNEHLCIHGDRRWYMALQLLYIYIFTYVYIYI